MSIPADDNVSLSELELDVKEELVTAETLDLEEAAGGEPGDDWTDPDAERYEVSLRVLLGAVEAVEDGPGEPGGHSSPN